MRKSKNSNKLSNTTLNSSIAKAFDALENTKQKELNEHIRKIEKKENLKDWIRALIFLIVPIGLVLLAVYRIYYTSSHLESGAIKTEYVTTDEEQDEHDRIALQELLENSGY